MNHRAARAERAAAARHEPRLAAKLIVCAHVRANAPGRGCAPRFARYRALRRERSVEVEGRLGAHMLDAAAALGAEPVEAQAVGRGVDLRDQPGAAAPSIAPDRPRIRTPRTAPAGRSRGRRARRAAAAAGRPRFRCSRRRLTSISIETAHFQTNGGIAVEIAAQVAGEQLRLDVREEAERHGLLQEGVAELVALALLPGHQHASCAPSSVRRTPPASSMTKSLGPELPAVDQAERQPVGQHRAELLHEVEREARRGRAGRDAGSPTCRVEADASPAPSGNRGPSRRRGTRAAR